MILGIEEPHSESLQMYNVLPSEEHASESLSMLNVPPVEEPSSTVTGRVKSASD